MTNPVFTVPEITTKDLYTYDAPEHKKENVAIVTGAGGGIGAATAYLYAFNGVTTLFVDYDEEKLKKTIQKGIELGIDAELMVPFTADLTIQEDREEIVEFASGLGAIKWLFNIAGKQHVSPIAEFPDEELRTMIELMLIAPTKLTELVWNHMVEAGGGVIANMGSIHTQIHTKNKVAYNIAKAGLLALTNTINAEGAGLSNSKGEKVFIRSISVETGYVGTDLAINQIPATAKLYGITEEQVYRDVMMQLSLIKTMMTPMQVAKIFIVNSSSHFPYLTGSVRHASGSVETYTTVFPEGAKV